MKVSKNQIQNVSFSSSKEEVTPQQSEPSVQGGEEKMAKSLECLASQVPVVQKDSFAKQKATLEERLNVLNITTACHREYLSKDDEDLEKLIALADTEEKIAYVNSKLDKLDTDVVFKDSPHWAYAIVEWLQQDFKSEE